MSKVVVVDYGLGNLLSVARALKAVGAEPEISADPITVATAERLVLPGVGAFGDGMKGLKERNLVAPIKKFVATGRPFMGLCLGMQLCLDESSEFGTHEGLGLVPGKVEALALAPGFKVPHVGWNALSAKPSRWKGTAFDGLDGGAQVYFVHSFAAQPKNPADVLAACAYGPAVFCAAIQKDNVTGCQFHPEKSADAGLKILARFVAN